MTTGASQGLPVVDVFLRPAHGTRDASLLADAVARIAGTAADEVRLDVRCPRCGAAGHGKPSVTAPLSRSGARLHASLSRATGMVAVAVTDVASVGLDLTSIAGVGRAPIDAALHERELAALAGLDRAARGIRLAQLWAAKEAVLKATGLGLNVDPGELAIGITEEGAELVGRPAGIGLETRPRLMIAEPAPGLLMVIALLSPEPFSTRIHSGAAAAPLP